MADDGRLEQAPSTAAADAAPAAAPAAAPDEPLRPVIRKIIVEEGHGGAHGGAWKIALADMMTAMMAFFLLMWLLGASNEDQRKSIADYFRPASHSQVRFGELAGSEGLLGGKSITDPDGFPFTAEQTAMLERLTPRAQGGPAAGQGNSQEDQNAEGPQRDAPTNEPSRGPAAAQDDAKFGGIQKELTEKIAASPRLQALRDQVNITRDKDGLRIEIIDKADFSMFRLGTSDMDPRAAALLAEISASVRSAPNKVVIRGHTDSLGYAAGSARNNWTLSAERADATRRLMEASGVPSGRFDRIEGVADRQPHVPSDPSDPRNRRVSITLLNQ